MSARIEKVTPGTSPGATPDRHPFKAPTFRVWPSGKAATMPQYGQRFSIRPEDGEFVLYHRPFRSFAVKCYECLARFDTMHEAQAAAVEIARMAYDDPDAFQKPEWIVEREEGERQQWRAESRAKDERLRNNPAYRAGGMVLIIEDLLMPCAVEMLQSGARLPDDARYRLSAALASVTRAIRSLTASEPQGDGTVIPFPAGRR